MRIIICLATIKRPCLLNKSSLILIKGAILDLTLLLIMCWLSCYCRSKLPLHTTTRTGIQFKLYMATDPWLLCTKTDKRWKYPIQQMWTLCMELYQKIRRRSLSRKSKQFKQLIIASTRDHSLWELGLFQWSVWVNNSDWMGLGMW